MARNHFSRFLGRSFNKAGKRRRRGGRSLSRKSIRAAHVGGWTYLSHEHLESRIVLNADPVLAFIPDQVADEGALLEFTADFTDIVESEAGGGSTIGFNPDDYTSLGSFDPTSNVVIDTDLLTISGFAGTGVVETADTGAGTFEIAVFAFSDFELDAGITITASGSRPFALLSQGDLTVAGTIDVSATFDPMLSGNQVNGERIAGPGGGDGGLGGNAGAGDTAPTGPNAGLAAAGAPADSVGSPKISTAALLTGGGGTGAGFGALGGNSEGPGTITPSGRNPYGDLSIAIQGGSGGGTAGGGVLQGGNPHILAGGGGGGGGIELGAVGTLTIASGAQVLADGGDAGDALGFSGAGGGGGGAGGGILLHATNVTQSGTLSAVGGMGGTAERDGGGGAGGRILIVYSTAGTFDNTGGTQTAVGGAAGGSGGAAGGTVPGPPADAFGVIVLAEAPAATPVLETFDFVVDWGDFSLNDTGSAVISAPASYPTLTSADIGAAIVGSFDLAHIYDDDGIYTVTVTINSRIDGIISGSDSQMLLVTVDNLDPTITVANAAVTVDEGATANNSGTFDDVPADTVTLSASIGTVVDAGGGNWSWSFDSTDGPDDTQMVIITAEDEDGGESSVMFDLTVNNVAPTADAGGPYTAFVDIPITLNGSGSDVPADTLTYEWFLGGVDDVLFSTDASATFDPEALGIFTTTTALVTLRVTDDDGDSSIATSTVSVLGPGSWLVDGTLHIIGSDTDNDCVFVKHVNGEIKVYATFNDDNPVVFDADDVNHINIRTRGGNDKVIVSHSVDIDTTIDGGSGNDMLLGGSGSDMIIGGAGNDLLAGQAGDDMLLAGDGQDDLFGGSGNDVLVAGDEDDMLFGGSGRDVMIGGQDNDFLNGGSGDDILIGGYTVHDNDTAALDSVMAIWSSSDSFDDRVNTLTGSGGLLESGVAVFDDGDTDVLIGGSGRDLVFADITWADGDKDFVIINHHFDHLEVTN